MNLSKTIVLTACVALILSIASIFAGAYSFDEPNNYDVAAPSASAFDEPNNYDLHAQSPVVGAVSFDEPNNYD